MYQKTAAAGIKVGGVGLNYYRKFPNLKTAKDRFINTPNNDRERKLGSVHSRSLAPHRKANAVT